MSNVAVALLLTIVLVGLVTSVQADAQEAMNIPASSCSLGYVADQYQGASRDIEWKNAELGKSNLEELKAIVAKAPDNTQPIGPQLSIPDRERFTILIQRLQYLRMMTYFEQTRARDAKAILEMSKMALALYYGASKPNDDDPALAYWSFIQALRETFPPEQVQLSTPNLYIICNYAWALHQLEEVSISRVNVLNPQIEAGRRLVAEIGKKQGLTPEQPPDPAKASPADRATMAEIQRDVMQPAEHEWSYINDLENIQSLAAASEIMYMANREDFVRSSGNGTMIGSTIRHANYDDRTRRMFAAWDDFSKKVPPDTADWQKTIGDLQNSEAR